MERPFLRIAHRGFAAIGRDNALETISAALRLGADMIEVDVRLSSEGRIVLDHDNADAPGAPLMRDALDLIAAAGAGVLLDLKVPGIPGAIARLLDEHAPNVPVVVSGHRARFRVTPRAAVRASRVAPVGATRDVIRRAGRRVVASLHAEPQRGVVLRTSMCSSRIPRHSHGGDETATHRARRLRLDGRRAAMVERMIDAGVDGIISDHPRSLGLSA